MALLGDAQQIQLRTFNGARTIKISAIEIIDEAVAIHLTAGTCVVSCRADYANVGKFTATHIATGQAIVSFATKHQVMAIARTFLDLLPKGLHDSENVDAVCEALPVGFRAWINRILDGSTRPWG